MRFLIIILTIVTSFAFAQNTGSTVGCRKAIDSLTLREVYYDVDVQAYVIGGLNKSYSELGTIEIPKDSSTDQINIFIHFIVESNGDIAQVSTTSKIKSTTLDYELLQLFKKYKWEPATCKGVKVPTILVLRVVS
jgi:hypothetical protein